MLSIAETNKKWVFEYGKKKKNREEAVNKIWQLLTDYLHQYVLQDH